VKQGFFIFCYSNMLLKAILQCWDQQDDIARAENLVKMNQAHEIVTYSTCF